MKIEDKEMYYKDKKTGETYVAPLSIEKMDKIYRELSLGNKLKIYLLIGVGIIIIIGIVIISTDVLQNTLRLIARC